MSKRKQADSALQVISALSALDNVIDQSSAINKNTREAVRRQVRAACAQQLQFAIASPFTSAQRTLASILEEIRVQKVTPEVLIGRVAGAENKLVESGVVALSDSQAALASLVKASPWAANVLESGETSSSDVLRQLFLKWLGGLVDAIGVLSGCISFSDESKSTNNAQWGSSVGSVQPLANVPGEAARWASEISDFPGPVACLGFARLLKSFQTKSLPKLVHVASDVVTEEFQETVLNPIGEVQIPAAHSRLLDCVALSEGTIAGKMLVDAIAQSADRADALKMIEKLDENAALILGEPRRSVRRMWGRNPATLGASDGSDLALRLLARKFQMRGNISGRQRLIMSALRVMLKQVVEAVRTWDLTVSEADRIRSDVNDMQESFGVFAETSDERDFILGLIAEIAHSAQRRIVS